MRDKYKVSADVEQFDNAVKESNARLEDVLARTDAAQLAHGVEPTVSGALGDRRREVAALLNSVINRGNVGRQAVRRMRDIDDEAAADAARTDVTVHPSAGPSTGGGFAGGSLLTDAGDFLAQPQQPQMTNERVEEPSQTPTPQVPRPQPTTGSQPGVNHTSFVPPAHQPSSPVTYQTPAQAPEPQVRPTYVAPTTTTSSFTPPTSQVFVPSPEVFETAHPSANEIRSIVEKQSPEVFTSSWGNDVVEDMRAAQEEESRRAYRDIMRQEQAAQFQQAREIADAQERQRAMVAAQYEQMELAREDNNRRIQEEIARQQEHQEKIAALREAGGSGIERDVTDSSVFRDVASDPEMKSILNALSAEGLDDVIESLTETEEENAASGVVGDDGEALSRDEVRDAIREVLEEFYEDDEEGLIDGIVSEGNDGGNLDPTGLSGLSPDEVSFEKTVDGQLTDEQVWSVVNDAADLNGIPNDPEVRERWYNLMRPMGVAESGLNSSAANGWDSNAWGETQSDGYPFNSSRGIWQTIPTTFAAHHVEGTSNSIYDPQASCAAAMHYIMDRYGVSPDTSEGMDAFASARGIDLNTGRVVGTYKGY